MLRKKTSTAAMYGTYLRSNNSIKTTRVLGSDQDNSNTALVSEEKPAG